MGDHPVMKWALIALIIGFVMGYVAGTEGFSALTSPDQFLSALTG